MAGKYEGSMAEWLQFLRHPVAHEKAEDTSLQRACNML
jgi:hypothetical protein